MIEGSHIGELSAKVEKLAKDLLASHRENVRLRRLLAAAESRIKELGSGGVPNADVTNILELTKQVEKLKQERKIIREKVERMSTSLDKFYHE